MDYQKLDAALAMALNEVHNPEERSLDIYIHTKPLSDSSIATSFLKNLNASNITGDNDIFTATLSLSEISKLSDQPWVQYLKLSQKLRLMDRKLGMRRMGTS